MGRAYGRVHYAARKVIGDACTHCGSRDKLEAALRPDTPESRLLLDSEFNAYYSEDLRDYFALCIPCHRRLDHVELRPTCRRGHPYEPGNTSIKSDGSRRCLTCHRDQAARRLADPEKRAVKNAADRAYRATNPMTSEQKARKLELQRIRRARAKAADSDHIEQGGQPS